MYDIDSEQPMIDFWTDVEINPIKLRLSGCMKSGFRKMYVINCGTRAQKK